MRGSASIGSGDLSCSGKKAKRPVENGPLRVLGVGRGTKPRGGLLTGSDTISLIFATLICLLPADCETKEVPLFVIPVAMF